MLPITVQLKNSNLKLHLEVEVKTGRLRATQSGSCSGFLTEMSISSYSDSVWPCLPCPWAHWSRDVLQNVWCSGTLTSSAALVLVPANVGGRDGAFFSPNAGEQGCCQGMLGLQQATKVTFLVLVYIIKHSKKNKKIFSVCEGLWVICPESLAHTHVFLTAVGNTHLKWNLVSSFSRAFVLIIFPRERGELEYEGGWLVLAEHHHREGCSLLLLTLRGQIS